MFAFDIASCLLLTRVCLKIYEPAKVIDYQANKRFVALYRIINNHVLAIYFEQRVNSLSTDRSSLLLSRIFSLYRICNLWYEIYDIRNIIIHNKSIFFKFKKFVNNEKHDCVENVLQFSNTAICITLFYYTYYDYTCCPLRQCNLIQ